MPEQRSGLRRLQEALRTLEVRGVAGQKAAGRHWSRRAAAADANRSYNAGGLDARRIGDWLNEPGRAPRDADQVWALVRVWSAWAGDGPGRQERGLWNALVEAAQPISVTENPPAGPSKGPWMAPPGAPGTVARIALNAAVLDAVLASGSEQVPVTAVYGAGGFGKSTLVRDACTDPRVRDRFTGGLLWTDLGQAVGGTDLALRLNDLTEQLTGERPALSDPQQAGFRFGAAVDALARPVLLVIDDAWREDQLRPFLLGGEGCRRLVVARRRLGLLSSATSVDVPAMTAQEAADLITRGVRDLSTDVVDELVALTGRWPLLLSLTNRTIARQVGGGRESTSAAKLVAERLRASGPAALDRPAVADEEHRDDLVAASLAASIDVLPDATADRYLELGIFPTEADIPLAVLDLLWSETGGIDPFEVELL
ncbi:NB-ARC domain-containing protein, partial [Virgisporangium aurantiacum]|uniref:NB-ARC domain-containing protein n=1 Tax=Virgisporangium aurantiacum TaxID=175570 RepID=UPI00194F406F